VTATSDVVLGVAGSGPVAVVDATGRIRTTATDGSSFVADVWFGGASGWVRPATEATLRRRAVEGTPVVETVVRVEGADVVRRTYAAMGPSGPQLVAEVTVEGRLPVAAALLWRRDDGRPLRVALDGPALLLDDVAVVVGARPPGSVRAGGGADEVVERLAEPGIDEVGSLVAAVWPLAHGSTTRFALAPLPDGATASTVLPTADQVVRGWIRQIEGGTRVEVGDDGSLHRLRSMVAEALVLSPGSASPAVAAVLDDWGHHGDAVGVLARLTEVPDVDADHVRLLGALDHHQRRTADVEFARAAVPSVLVAVDALRGRGDPSARAAVAQAARLLEVAGEPAAAAVARRPRRRLFGRSTPTAAGSPPPAVDPLRAFLVDDDTDGTLDLLTGWTADLVGRPMEVVGLPTRFGPVSFALRWHGPNVALLWELDLAAGVAAPVLRCGSVDDAWSTTALRGEALLVPRVTVVDGGSTSFS